MIKTKKNTKKSSSGYRFISTLFTEFHVSSENELIERLIEESGTLACTICKNEYPIDFMHFPQGDPICKFCCPSDDCYVDDEG